MFILIFSCLAAVLFTHPFLVLPFDAWEHLIKIRSIFDDGKCFLYWPEDVSSFCSWHLSWAKIFSIINIKDTFLWASIIHYTQFLFALFSLFYFSFSVFQLCEKHAPPDRLFLIAFFATLYWLVGNGTHSLGYQQAWIMWYSITYQGLTIPLFWLITGLTLQLFFADGLSHDKKLIFPVLIGAGFLVIAFFHPSEAVYYAVYLLFCLLFTPSMSFKQKIIYTSLFLTLVPSTLFVVATYLKLPFLYGISILNDFTDIIQQINATGTGIAEKGGNRLRSSLSELAMLSSIAALAYWVVNLLLSHKKTYRVLSLLTAALVVFSLIPTVKWLAGTTGLVLHEDIVWRFFFASPWFLFIPFIIFKLTRHSRFPKVYTSLLLLATLSGTFFISALYLNKALSGNVHSLYNSFFKERVGLQYTDENLEILKQTIEGKTKPLEKRNVMLYVRGDLATLARAVYGYYAFSHRRISIPLQTFYANRMERRYTLVPINPPPGFPKDRNIFLHFMLDKKDISSPQNLPLQGKNTVRFNLDHIDLSKEYLVIEGWAFLIPQLHESRTYIVLQSDQETFIFDTSQMFRRSVGKRFRSMELENQGFLATIQVKDINPGTYRIGVVVKEKDQQGFILSKLSVKIPRVDTSETSN